MKTARYGVLAAVATFMVGLFVTSGFAVTVDKTAGGAAGYPAHMMGKVALLERTIDFSNTTSLTGTAANVYQLIKVPAGTLVLKVMYEIETNSGGYQGENGTCTIDIGDGSDTDGYIDGANVETGQTATVVGDWTLGSVAVSVVTNQYVGTGGSIGTNTTRVTIYPITTAPKPYANGKLYTSADTIDLILNNNADQLKITVRALAVPVAGL